jgi:hypothetical protein
MPIRAVLVNLTTNSVDNFFNFASQSALLTANVQVASSNARWIGENDWADGQNPANGDIWDGVIPASFAPAAVDPDGPSTLLEAKQAVDAKMAELAAAQAALAALIPLA